MTIVARPRWIRILFASTLCVVALGVAAIAAKPAQASPATITGGETSLEVNLSAFVPLVNAGIWATAIPPARLEFGSTPTVFFPIRSGGVVDVAQKTGLVRHRGGLRMTKGSTTVDTTNLTIKCDAVLGCSLLGNGLRLVPTEVAQLQDFKMTRRPGVITFTSTAVLREPTVTVLNTLFNTTVFKVGMQLGVVRSTMQAQALLPVGG